MPINLEITKDKKNILFTIRNAEEKINLLTPKIVNDSFQVDFPNFHSFIRFKMNRPNDLDGFWYNLNKGSNYKIPFSAEYRSIPSKNPVKQNYDLTGRWKATFSPDTKNEEFAVGVFKTQQTVVTGTFLTETGDYRFLSGEVCENAFYLSCFDGARAFYFTGEVNQNQISGTFFSGNHYQTNWTARRDDNFHLQNPDSLTYLVQKDDFKFKMKTLEGGEFLFPNKDFENKVCIIQIMGSWCPNCLDESRFLKEMYDKYHQSGLEIISVGYETPVNFEEQVQKIEMLKAKLGLEFIFLVGGQANKNLASEQFSMLNKIISFPTAIFINRKGEVVKIHTGFNGPGTGEIYSQFKEETEHFIQKLLE